MIILIIAGISGAAGVALGAYGAHALSKKIDGKSYQSYSNAVRYQQLHSVLLAGLGWILIQKTGSTVLYTMMSVTGGVMIAGILLFSGSIYASLFTGKESFTKWTPFGGILLIISWLLIAVTGFLA